MEVQCAACKKNFDLADVSKEQSFAAGRENLCNECLLAHIEMLVCGQGRRADKGKQARVNIPQQAA